MKRTKSILFTIAVLNGLFLFLKADALASSCNGPMLKLISVQGSDSSSFQNPDSVMIDTCQNSPTYGEKYAKRWWKIYFAYYVINVPSAPPDTILEMPWTQVDYAFSSLRAALEELEDKYGTVTLRKVNPSCVDSTNPASKF